MLNASFEQLKRDLLAEPSATTTEMLDEDESDAPPALSIEVDGVPITLAVLASNEDEAMLCADCGEIPALQETDVMRAVLDASLLTYRDLGATFCTNPVTRHLLLLGRVRLAETSAQRIVEMARQFAAAVNRFDQDHFISDTSSLPDHGSATTFERV